MSSPSRHLLHSSEHFYRAFLLLYPKEFRHAYGPEMVQTFRDCCRETLQQQGASGLTRLWTHILYDLLITAFIEHIRICFAQFKRLLGIEKSCMVDRLLNLDVALRTDTGLKRHKNEDSMLSILPEDKQVMTRKGALFVVADGMGGHAAGEVASQMAVEVVSTSYYENEVEDIATALTQAIHHANILIYRHTETDPHTREMGTTCIAAVLHNNTVYIANVGDSRAYIVHHGQAHQISQDHSWVEEQVRAGLLTKDQARTHTHRNIITRCLGTHINVEVDIFLESVQEGDVLILCTDGLSGVVEDHELCAIVEHHGPEDSVSRLIECANERGGPDNITTVVARVGYAQHDGTELANAAS